MSKNKFPLRHLPLVLLDNGWYIKASDWEGSHITFFIVSKYTGETFIQYFTNQHDATNMIKKLSMHSARKFFCTKQNEEEN